MKEKVFLAVISILIIILICIPTGFENPVITDSSLQEKGIVLETDNSDLRSFSIITTGTQELKLLIRSGKFSGDTVTAQNVLLGQKKVDKIFKPGDKVLTVLQLDKNREKYIGARAADYYRQDIIILLFICFALFLILFSRIIGLKAIISFVFTALTFWKILIPLYLKGFSPLLVAIAVIFLCTVVIILLVGGINKKGFVALFGTMAGVLATALLAIIFGYYFNIPGTVQEYSEALLYTGFVHLNLSDIFISVIFISSAGAVMDISMDISASQYEIVSHMPDIPRKTLIKSGFRIASPVVGSMTTTLLFAYSGCFMFAFMAFMAKGTAIQSIINTSYIAAEILHTLVGSFGLVLVAPFTAIIGGYVFTSKSRVSIPIIKIITSFLSYNKKGVFLAKKSGHSW